jgi:TATA-binding protein-associated factor
MSDPDESVRLLSTSTFASLVKMVPLEAGIPDPPGFSAELLAKRDEERKFLMQLLDGSKAEQYHVPIEIKADLRQYQKDGVSWLAFLAKYQLHGILCDGMFLLSFAFSSLISRHGLRQESAVDLYHWVETP